MSIYLEVEWTSDEEVSIPNHGMTFKGRKLYLPEKIATSFINRKMAKTCSEKIVKSSKAKSLDKFLKESE